MRLEQVAVQRIGDEDDLVPCGQRALAGFFLQVCECAMVLAVVLAQRLEALL